MTSGIGFFAGAGLLATGCGAASTAGNFPVVVAHPNVQTTDVPSVEGDAALLLASSRVVFNTTGSSSCVWLPTRLTVLDSSSIRIDMRVNGQVEKCAGGSVPFPIAVKIPRSVDAQHALTVRLEYRVHVPGEQTTRHWEHTVVAAALSR